MNKSLNILLPNEKRFTSPFQIKFEQHMLFVCEYLMRLRGLLTQMLLFLFCLGLHQLIKAF